MLMNRGRLIEAQQVLSGLVRSKALTDEERGTLDDLLGSLDRRLRSADPMELSLQKAEAALAEGDIALMNRQLQPVLRRGESTQAQRELGRELTAEGEKITASVATLAEDFVAQAKVDFIDGRFGRAKSTLAVLTRAGVELTPEADAIRTQLFNIELERGQPFAIVEAAGLFQPGVLTRIADDKQQLADADTRDTLLDLFGDADFDDQPGVIRRDDDDDDVPPLDAPIDLTDDQPEGDQPLPDDIIDRTMRADAQAKLAQANQAFARSEFTTALNLYNEILAASRSYLTAEQIQEAEQNATDARITLGNQPDPAS